MFVTASWTLLPRGVFVCVCVYPSLTRCSAATTGRTSVLQDTRQ